MGTDWVQLFDLALARRILAMDRAGVARWLDQDLIRLQERSCRRAEQWAEVLLRTARASGTDVNPAAMREELCGDYAREWEERRARVWEVPARPDDWLALRDEVAEAAAIEGEHDLHMDYWGCYAEVFSAKPPADGLSSRALLANPDNREEERFKLLSAGDVERMERSLRAHRAEWQIWNDQKMARLASFRDRCARDPALRVAYYFDV